MSDMNLDVRELERLAAFLDGRLSAQEARRVEERLASDEEYYELFAEAVAFAEEEAAVAGEGVAEAAAHRGRRVLPFGRRWRARLPAVGLVAAAVVAIVATALLLTAPPPPVELVAQLDAASATAPAPGIEWSDPGWSRRRGAEAAEPEWLSSEERAFRLGARMVQLALAVEAGRSGEVARLARSAAFVAEAVEVEVALDELARAASGGEREASAAFEVAQRTARAAVAGDGATLGRYALGEWVELGRLAARAGDAELLGGRSFRRLGERLDPGVVPPQAAAGMATIRRRLAGNLSAAEARGLESDFAALAGRLAGG